VDEADTSTGVDVDTGSDCVKHNEGLEGAARKGMVELAIWDFTEPENLLFPVLHVQTGLVDNVINWMHA
jgi:hypothetical protein